jgi:hypothetical protein
MLVDLSTTHTQFNKDYFFSRFLKVAEVYGYETKTIMIIS